MNISFQKHILLFWPHPISLWLEVSVSQLFAKIIHALFCIRTGQDLLLLNKTVSSGTTVQSECRPPHFLFIYLFFAVGQPKSNAGYVVRSVFGFTYGQWRHIVYQEVSWKLGKVNVQENSRVCVIINYWQHTPPCLRTMTGNSGNIPPSACVQI